MTVFGTTQRQVDIGLTILRTIVGAIFVAHGAQKLFVFGLDGVAGGFAQMGIPLAGILGPMVALLEFFGGFALIGGFLTRLVSLGLASTMIVAILQVHLPAGFFNPAGVEFPLSLLGSSVALAVTGAGAWSIDAILGRKSGVRAEVSARKQVKRAA